MVSPADAVQENLVRVMYVHVPAAWLAYLAFFVTLVGSAGYLATRSLRWDRIAAASAEIGVYFTGLAIVLGMIWGKPTWGVWWTWDARLTLTAIMFFVYLGYLALRRTTTDPHLRAKRAAVLGIIGIVQIPLVHFSVTWWRTLHQAPSLIRPDGPQIQDSLMLVALVVGVVAFTAIYGALMVKRVELQGLEEQLIAGEQGADRPVAGDAVTAPDLALGGEA
jgi:heme exporter protein C